MNPLIKDIKSIEMKGALRTLAGGTASRLGGGKFASGATSAAMGFLFNDVLHEDGGGRSAAQEKIVRTESENSILYEKGNASVLVQNDVQGNGIPQVSEERISHALDVSAQEGGKRVTIISGYNRDPGHPNASINHERYDAIDVYIEGYNSTETARALYNSGHFHRTAGYPNSRLQSAHGDNRTTHRGGCFVEWGGESC